MPEYKLEGIAVMVYFRQLVSVEYNLYYVAACIHALQSANPYIAQCGFGYSCLLFPRDSRFWRKKRTVTRLDFYKAKLAALPENQVNFPSIAAEITRQIFHSAALKYCFGNLFSLGAEAKVPGRKQALSYVLNNFL